MCIRDRHSFALTAQGGGGDGDIVEEAKAHCSIRQSVVSGWPCGDEADAVVSTAQLVNDGETRPRRVLGDRERVQCGVGIRVDVAPAGIAVRAEFIEIVATVNSHELATRGGVCRYDDEVAFEV